MDNNRNVLIAISLSFVVLLAWQFFVAGPKIEAERQRKLAEQAQIEPSQPGAPGAPESIQTPQPGQVPQAPAAPQTPQAGTGAQVPTPAIPGAPGAAMQSRQAALAGARRVVIETPSLKGSLNLTGARIDDLLLTKYRETIDPKSPLIELFSPIGSDHPYYAEFGWVAAAGGPAVPDAQTEWSADVSRVSADGTLTLSWDNGAGLTFQRIISIDSNYMFTVRQSVTNSTGAPVTLYPYGLVNRHGLPKISGFFILHEGLIGVLGEEGLQEVDYDDLEDVPAVTPPRSEDGWIGITDKYWAAALIPAGSRSFQSRFLKGASGEQPTFQADFLGDPVTVAASGSASHETLLFAGAKEVDVINAYESSLNIDRFSLLIDWGWFYFLTKPLFQVIQWLFNHLGNFGLAILAVTVLVKLIFFPLANKSYASMSKMKKVQPEVKKLQERYKDDRMGLQQEMMKLYKNEKINPLSGCWPIMIQIPVFFALYKVLFVSIEMRHAPFFGWIKDLSAPDPTSVFNLFGLIPYTPPQFLMLGVWPLIMGVTMFIQMRMNPTPPDKTQAMIFAWMPVMFTFMLASFPAGLVIYWAWNNFLSILQQGAIMKRHGVKIELFDNLLALVGKGSAAANKDSDGPDKDTD
ncbi:MAG: membrane protein insertase YidC [Hyphomicrobiales bacterium]|nr:membrane protein insertase YidC [Hyphomicrobiales bacterium]